MIISHRPFAYESRDFESMCRFVTENCGLFKNRVVWRIGRLVDWKYTLFNFAKCFPDNFSREAELWFDWYGDLIGFVLAEEFGPDLAFFARPEWQSLLPDMVRWAKAHWENRHETLRVMVVEDHETCIAALEAAGFARADGFERTCVFDTSRYAEYVMPDASVRFEDMTANGDYDAHDAIRTDAWPKSQTVEEQRQIRDYMRRSPIYDPHFDYVLVTNEGRAVSSCEAFIDRKNGVAEIERVCTLHSEWGKGYARMLLLACLRRVHEAGIPTAVITGGYDKTIHLYGDLGHVDAFDLHPYQWTKPSAFC